MGRSTRSTTLPAVLALAAALSAGTLGAQAAPAAAKAKAATQLKYGPAPAMLPPGAQLAVVDGDHGKAGPFTVRLRMPAGYRIAPHSHPTDETITVQRGTFSYGMGDKWQSSTMKSMKAGQSGTMKAGENHYARSRTRTELEIKSTGPFEINYVNPSDDPRNKKEAKPKAE